MLGIRIDETMSERLDTLLNRLWWDRFEKNHSPPRGRSLHRLWFLEFQLCWELEEFASLQEALDRL